MSLEVQWLRLGAPTTGSADSIPGWGTEILHAMDMAKKKAEFALRRQRLQNETPLSLFPTICPPCPA